MVSCLSCLKLHFLSCLFAHFSDLSLLPLARISEWAELLHAVRYRYGSVLAQTKSLNSPDWSPRIGHVAQFLRPAVPAGHLGAVPLLPINGQPLEHFIVVSPCHPECPAGVACTCHAPVERPCDREIAAPEGPIGFGQMIVEIAR